MLMAQKLNWVQRGSTPFQRGLRRATAYSAGIALLCLIVTLVISISIAIFTVVSGI